MDKTLILLSPPFVVLIIFVFLSVLSYGVSRVSYKNNGKKKSGAGKSYACGEDVPDHMAQPDYSQFFPYAFFFTIAHVATLMVTTLPTETIASLVIAVIYIVAVVIGLYILLRRS
jgi:NADH:ubiquinone oxidoreductase subunit 3 (subunit A)